MSENSAALRRHLIISHGPNSGCYQGFPDACRLRNGEIVVVFYAGYAHVSEPKEEYPNGGRICLTRSSDEGRTWDTPRVIYDDADDNRDPHIAQLSDGSLICTFFSIRRDANGPEGFRRLGVHTLRSADNGSTWEDAAHRVPTGAVTWCSSAPVRELPDGTCLLPVYYQGEDEAWGGVLHSRDMGRTWGPVIPIGQHTGRFLPAETDIIQLRDGSLFAALRGDRGANMHYALSPDGGLTWSEARDLGFPGHAPHLNRLSTGEILLTYRGPVTNLRVSRDEGQTWQGPYTLDTVWGAYPSTVELKDGSVLAIYYEDEAGSAVRALRFEVPGDLKVLELG